MTRADGEETSIIVGLGQLGTTATPGDVLISVGLGSCVALCAHDPKAEVAGMAHMLLPASRGGRKVGPDTKFVDLAIPLLLEEMEAFGAQRSRMCIKLAGGAQMINGVEAEGRQIGMQNVASARATLAELGLRIHGEDIGGTQGRTVRLFAESGRLVISRIGGASYDM